MEKGQKVNCLTAIMKYTNRNDWLFECDCGKRVIYDYKRVLRGYPKSCGCLRIKKLKETMVDDLVGKKYNHLTVLYATGNIEGKRGFFWHCKCDCGNEIDVLGSSLKSGNTTACGCRQKIGWENGYKHGLTHTRLHSIWNGMKQRCFSKNNDYYYNYGGRGITMCDEWKNDFKAFYNWSIKNGYSDNLTIDRIDNDGNYEPSNCRWITRTEQMRNTRRSRKFSYKGEMKTASELSEICGIPSVIIYHRIAILNWNIEDAMSKPVKKYKRSS